MSTLMALLYGFLWRLLLVLVYVNRALVSLLRVWFRSWKDRLSERVTTALLLPVALTGFPDHRKKLNHNPNANASPVSGNYAAGSRSRWLSDGRSLEKLPVHIGLLVAEEEPSYTDIANLVVWCMAVGISYVSVYDNHGIFRKNNSHLLEEIVQQQQDLLGVDGSKYSVEFLSNASDMHQHHVVSCRPTVKVLSPEDGKQSIVQAAQQLCRSVENKQRRSKDISVSMLDILLRESKNIPDPELVLKFGPVDSTLGFLPWHIRLTEFISLPSHRNVSYKALLGALQQYSTCQQRLGQ
ncbi:dehydrodolichyl diphosphate synthase complex subunit nus1 isoform X1 [Echeneis naucrates]|uniref:ditrans,polycis-polyprenyl diphosphate synthase [(2E,6E)-farnesyldiphosphate specific] n=1 Tax=Echeneis naucrates TaxID=173247 RepID=A0A665WKR2_ECHNA|nr:dehydrodolichyl diphosphate synthase complex subunit NUS1 isoform X1 [Echeneis naucrates]